MIAIARGTLKNNEKKGLITQTEADIAAKTEPEFNIRYYADRNGEAKVSWKMPERRITVDFRGDFLEPHMRFILQITKNQPDQIDFRTIPRNQPNCRPAKGRQPSVDSPE